MSLIPKITWTTRLRGLHIEECGCFKIRRWIMAFIFVEFVVVGLLRTKCPSTTSSQGMHTTRFWLVIFNQPMGLVTIERAVKDGHQK